MKSRNLVAAALLLAPVGALAQEASCPSAVTLGVKADSATSPGAARPMITGRPVAASLHIVDRIFFAVPPRERPIARTYGGTFAVEIAEAGTWRIAVDAEAAIDLVQGGRILAPVAESTAKSDCFLRQARFHLKPGRYLLQLSSSRLPVLSLLVEKTQK